jgi:hypothetical protein
MKNFLSDSSQIDLTYHSEWRDGFGAQGWKLNVAMDDPKVIACTAYTGTKSPTSVLVHDILDHLVSGFWLSGFKNEACATAIHGLRNGIEVRSSYESMTDDILSAEGVTNEIMDLLPASIANSIPEQKSLIEMIATFRENFDLAEVRSHIIEGFFRIGLSGIPIAISSWQEKRLDFEKMHSIGLCLQALLVEVQDFIKRWAVETAYGRVTVNDETCEFLVSADDPSKQKDIIKRVI